MASVVINSAQSAPGAVLTALYTVPASRRATGWIRATNIAAAGKTFRIAISPAGAAISNEHYLAYDMALAANDSETITGIQLKATDVLRVYGSDANVVFTYNYYEADA